MGAPLGTPSTGPGSLPNSRATAPCVSSTCDHNWDIVYYSQNANDYGGTFIAQANTIAGWGCSVSFCTGDANDLLILPLNIDIGTNPGPQIWFQFDIDFEQSCLLGVCGNHVSFLIWNNPNPTGYCGNSITYNYEQIPMTSPQGTPGLPYTPGDAYEWHFYATTTPNQVAFLVKDDTTGNYWWSTYTVPSENLVYDRSCFSPATAVESYIDTSVSTLTGVPNFQFFEGDDLQDIVSGGDSQIYGSSSQFLVTCDFCSTPTGPNDGYSLGMYQSFIENSSSGLWYWTLFQAGSEVPASITLSQDRSSSPISKSNDFGISYLLGGSPYETSYESMISSTGRISITVPEAPGTEVNISGESSGSSNNETWCLSNGCSNVSSTGGRFYYYSLLAQPTSYSIVGGGSASAPILSFTGAPVDAGPVDSPANYATALTTSIQNVWALHSSRASVTDPLGGSGTLERWQTATASWKISASSTLPTTISYYHQYYLTTSANPSDGGSVSPAPGWYDAGANVSISEVASAGWQFTSWSGSGPGSCSGSCSGVNMLGPITEVAEFGPRTYSVTFSETGLPTGTTWSVLLNGTLRNSTNSTITFYDPNGLYAYAITDVPGWHQATLPYSGSLTVSGADVKESRLSFTEVTYNATISESTLPAGLSWSITLNGNTQSLTTASGLNTLTWTGLANGTYAYEIANVPSWHQTTLPYDGTETINGASLAVNVTFTRVTYILTFTETGLVSGVNWSVILNGTSRISSNSTITFIEQNGTYSYDVGALANYVASPNSGSLIVSGEARALEITFSPTGSRGYVITFTESGLPSRTSWSVTLNGVSQTSTTTELTFTDMNGSYSYSIGSFMGYGPNPSNGTVSVEGASVSVALTYVKVYVLAFAETSLPENTNWSVTLTGISSSVVLVNSLSGGSLTRWSDGASIVKFYVSNGTYAYSTSATGYSGNSGSLTVNGQSLPPATVGFTPSSSPSAGLSILDYVIIGLVIVVVAICVAAVLLRRREIRPSGPKMPPPQPYDLIDQGQPSSPTPQPDLGEPDQPLSPP
jgi:hypothetical protein